MNVVVLIEGREAIPVRAIPLLANWRFMSPDTVAHVLGGTKDCNVSLLGDLQSNHILNGKVELMDRDWWTQFPLRELRALSDKIETDEVSHEAGNSDWRKQSLKELPAGAFVWKDDYQKLHDKCWNYSNQTIHGGLELLNSESEAQEADEDVGAQSETQPKWTAEEWAEHIRVKELSKESLETLERWREPRYSPFMLPELCEIVMEGFKHATPAEHQSAQNLLDERYQLNADIKRWEAKDESKPSEALIKEEKLEILRAKLAEIEGKIRVLRGDYPDSSEIPQSLAKSSGLSKMVALENVGDVPTKRKAKKPSIEKVALEYMRTVYKAGHFESAAKFHKHLIKTAGVTGSPFEMGTGPNARKLFCPAASSFYDVGTLGKIWAKIRAD